MNPATVLMFSRECTPLALLAVIFCTRFEDQCHDRKRVSWRKMSSIRGSTFTFHLLFGNIVLPLDLYDTVLISIKSKYLSQFRLLCVKY